MNQTTQRRVAVITDSSAYPPPGLVEKYDIHIVPLILMMEGKTWLDGVIFTPPPSTSCCVPRRISPPPRSPAWPPFRICLLS
jgi:hypothetical protein